ncbi:FAD-dependent oxidoreductase [Proteiniborus sp.]|uniref:L-aspartate oxidase n=1 Tax=Proteiniborus sp. TaxID=2079015 RepID=UPI00331B3771
MNYKTDVLVIGGGSAGLHAAIEAKKHGVKVILVYKKGGNATIMAAGGFAGNFRLNEEIDEERVNEVFVEDILKSGRNINNRKIVKKLVENSSKEIYELQKLGVKLYEEENGNIKVFHASGHSYPRTVRCVGGNTRQYYSTLRNLALELGVIIIEDVEIIDLVKVNGKVCGAFGIHKNNLIFFSSKSVILATGGISANYKFSTHRKGIQGNGLIMGLNAGARLVDMEFIQFMPTVIAYPQNLAGFIVTDTLRGEGAILLNKHLERFMEKYSPVKKDMETRDIISQSIFQEIYEGRGTERSTVYLDARHIDREKIKKSFTNYELLMKAGIDPKENLIEITPGTHYTCGGIKIDDNAYTGVEGLWAAGEVTGGLHGANRLGSVALTENIVFGKLAGKNAALYCLEAKKHFVDYRPDYSISYEGQNQEKHKEIIENLRNILSNAAGIVRNEDDLLKGLKDVEDILSKLESKEKEKNNYSYELSSTQAKSFALINYCILKSCLIRKESRGTHFRKDYVEEKEKLAEPISIERKGEKISHYFDEEL